MTKITEAARQMAADLSNAEGLGDVICLPGHFGASFGAPVHLAFARLCARFIAMQDDMTEIDRLLSGGDYAWGTRPHSVASIAAKYRVETDPLVADVAVALELTHVHFSSEENAEALIAELAKRGYEIGKAKP